MAEEANTQTEAQEKKDDAEVQESQACAPTIPAGAEVGDAEGRDTVRVGHGLYAVMANKSQWTWDVILLRSHGKLPFSQPNCWPSALDLWHSELVLFSLVAKCILCTINLLAHS